MSALGAHEHLSSSVKRCVASLQNMWQRVTDIHYQGGDQAPPADGSSEVCFQDTFQHLGFEAENPLFGMDSTSWLDDVDWNL